MIKLIIISYNFIKLLERMTDYIHKFEYTNFHPIAVVDSPDCLPSKKKSVVLVTEPGSYRRIVTDE